MAKRKTAKRKSTKSSRKSTKKKTAKKAAPKRKVTRKKAVKRTVTEVRIPKVSVKTNWNPFALAYTLGILAGLEALIIGILAKYGIWTEVAALLDKIYLSYSNTTLGIIAGTAEAAIWGIVLGFVVAWLYNKFN